MSVSPPRVKVVHVIHSLSGGGIERRALTVISDLDPRRYASLLVCIDGLGPLAEEASARGIDPIVVGRTRRFDASTVWRLVALLRRERPAIVHGWLSLANVYARVGGTIARVPVRIAAEGAVVPTLNSRRLARDAFLDRALGFATDAYVANSDAVAAGLRQRGVPSSRIVVVRNGVRIPDAARDEVRAVACEELGAAPGEPLIGMAARLDPDFKDQRTFLRAVAVLVRSGRAVRAAIIGAGTGRSGLERLARELEIADRVVFTGYRLDAARLIGALDVSVMLGFEHSEGFSNSVLEAMAAGVPLVATDIPPNREAVENGVHGLLVPARSVDDAASAIAQLLDDRAFAARLGAAARERAAREFSLEAQGEKTMELYERLLARKGRR
jgi:glycosyltransferase involved in cell wall biosynthesis